MSIQIFCYFNKTQKLIINNESKHAFTSHDNITA